MDIALPQKFPFILDRNLAKANWTGNRVCTSCDIVVLAPYANILRKELYDIVQSVAAILIKATSLFISWRDGWKKKGLWI